MRIISSQYAPAVLSLLYYNGSGGTIIIDKMLARNGDSVARTLSLHLVDFGQSAGATNLFKVTSIPPNGDTDLCEELIGAELANGDAIWGFADTASTITIRGNGRTRPA